MTADPHYGETSLFCWDKVSLTYAINFTSHFIVLRLVLYVPGYTGCCLGRPAFYGKGPYLFCELVRGPHVYVTISGTAKRLLYDVIYLLTAIG